MSRVYTHKNVVRTPPHTHFLFTPTSSHLAQGVNHHFTINGVDLSPPPLVTLVDHVPNLKSISNVDFSLKESNSSEPKIDSNNQNDLQSKQYYSQNQNTAESDPRIKESQYQQQQELQKQQQIQVQRHAATVTSELNEFLRTVDSTRKSLQTRQGSVLGSHSVGSETSSDSESSALKRISKTKVLTME